MAKQDRRGGIEHHREDCPCNACRGRKGLPPQIMVACKLSGEVAAWLRDLATQNGISPGKMAKVIILTEYGSQNFRKRYLPRG